MCLTKYIVCANHLNHTTVYYDPCFSPFYNMMIPLCHTLSIDDMPHCLMRRQLLRIGRSNIAIISRACSDSSKVLNGSLLSKLDVNTAPNSPLDADSRSKLKKNLEGKAKAPMSPSEMGMMETQASVITEILEDALESKALYGLFKDTPSTAELVNIKNVKVNRDLSHVDVVWGSDILERFVLEAYEKLGEEEGKVVEKRVYSSVTNALQRKESKFRTYIMRSMELRRVPRVFFAAPSLKALGSEVRTEAIAQWVQEEEKRQRYGANHSRSSNEGGAYSEGKNSASEAVSSRDILDNSDDEYEPQEDDPEMYEKRIPLDLWMKKPDSK